MTPVRVTAHTMGATVFQMTPATLEWTPEGTLRVTQTPPGQPPVVVLDTPPAGLRAVTSHTVNQSMLVLKPVEGKAVRVSLQGSMLAPEPHESADAYARRAAVTGVPPQQWWEESLAASGVKVARWGWGKSWAIAGGIVGGIIVLAAVIALLDLV